MKKIILNLICSLLQRKQSKCDRSCLAQKTSKQNSAFMQKEISIMLQGHFQHDDSATKGKLIKVNGKIDKAK